MGDIGSICVFCGSGFGRRTVYREAAGAFGRAVAGRGLELVYGGGHVGLMGVCADAALAAGGRVTGIIPVHLRRVEVEHRALSELVEVPTMHARKEEMIRRADAFVSLAGGIGTIDEAIEVITLRQLGQHAKPSVFIDVEGYWRPFLAALDHAIAEGFARDGIRDFYDVAEDVDDAFRLLGLDG